MTVRRRSRRPRVLTMQIVVRVEPELHEWLQAVSDEDGRTFTQTVRWILHRYMTGELHE